MVKGVRNKKCICPVRSYTKRKSKLCRDRGASVSGEALCSVACDRTDAAVWLHLPDSLVFRIGYEQIARGIQCDAVRIRGLRGERCGLDESIDRNESDSIV